MESKTSGNLIDAYLMYLGRWAENRRNKNKRKPIQNADICCRPSGSRAQGTSKQNLT